MMSSFIFATTSSNPNVNTPDLGDVRRFISDRWQAIEALLGVALRTRDVVVVVTVEEIFLRERRPLLRFLDKEFPDRRSFRKLRRPAEAGTVTLVILREEEIGVTTMRPLLKGGNA